MMRSFVHLGHGVAPELLGLEGGAAELLSDDTHDPDEARNEEDDEQGQFRAGKQQDPKVEQDQDRVLDEHLDGGSDGRFHLADVPADPGDDVPLALLGEEADGQGEDLVVYLHPHIPYDACADGNHHSGRAKIAGGLENGHHAEEEAEEE